MKTFRFRRASCIVIGIALVAVARFAAAQETPAMDLGSRLELFVDGAVLDSLTGTTLQLHHPTPAETVLRFDQPWEGPHCGYVTIIKDGDVYRLYYRGLPVDNADGSDAECTCYAESKDGVTFTKPKLGLFEMNGSRDNNVILHGMPPFSHNFAPFRDTRPGTPPEERFKALAGLDKTGLAAFVSADGIHWKKLREAPVITAGAFDSQNVGFWSDAEQAYLCYFRTWTGGFRTISRSTSPDFVNWTAPVEMSFGDTPREHLYTNQTQPYFRAPHLYIATAARFMAGRRVVSEEQAKALGGKPQDSTDCSDTVLLTSRGGSQYSRKFMEGFVRPGLGASNWTTRCNYVACGIVPTGEAEMSLYVQRNYGQPSQCLQRLTLRTDGFVSVNAPYGGGECRTKPLRFSGKRLIVNYATSAAGSVRVEIQDAAGVAIPGYTRNDADEIIGDEIARTVSWKGNPNVSALATKPIRLCFVLKDADLFSFSFGD